MGRSCTKGEVRKPCHASRCIELFVVLVPVEFVLVGGPSRWRCYGCALDAEEVPQTLVDVVRRGDEVTRFGG